MKFSDGYWCSRAGHQVLHPCQLQTITTREQGFTATMLTRLAPNKGGELDSAILTVQVDAVADGIVRVRLEHFAGVADRGPHFKLHLPDRVMAVVGATTSQASLTSGGLRAHFDGSDGYQLSFSWDDRFLTSSTGRSVGFVSGPPRVADHHECTVEPSTVFMYDQLSLSVGETIYGLGERFGPVVRNGQSIDLWNSDGGTATEQAYKNVPFYLSSAGYGVFVNHLELVCVEVGSEVNTRVQFSVPGQRLEYFVIAGWAPAEVLKRYTSLVGRAPQVPDWSYGLWLSTSFTTDYSEKTVLSLVDTCRERNIPIRVVHFDCYWMRRSHWCDFTWDPDQFPDPERMLRHLHDAGVKVCVWINPYIAQQSALFAEGMARGYLLRHRDGSVRQWDHWQSAMAWVDFTNPDARAWYRDHLRKLLRQGVDCFKTDFGERVPTDVVWHDGSDPVKMHNYYSYLYNETVWEAITAERGEAEALVFARSATAGGQQFPVHWGGDCEPTLVSMAETLRGGLSLGLSGFGYWSHDMGGFEGKPDPTVFIRWFPFGMLSSHSRLHGSSSYRVPWMYGDDAVAVAQRFTALKHRLMPYLTEQARAVTDQGLPLLRHMLLGFPNDPGSRYVDTQYLLGSELLVAPVFSDPGEVSVYLPTDGWTDLLSGRHRERSGWYQECHGLDSLPIYIRDGSVLALGADTSRPDYDWTAELTLLVIRPAAGLDKTVTVPGRGTRPDLHWQIRCDGSQLSVTSSSSQPWSVQVVGVLVATDSAPELPTIDGIAEGTRIAAEQGVATVRLDRPNPDTITKE